ncbi:MAG: hypothetical protein K9G31_03155 [Crocinitomicaceae bacterium]|nr:hypothetical protein [Crocinitomicaceae bacterium]MCF8444760.1 hypothetical protein [Crocinitomicaceae bacterium]
MDMFNIPKITPKIPNIPEIKNHNLADAFYEKLVNIIIDFEKNLNTDEEVGARLVSFGETIIIHIDDLGYWNPSLIYFYGRDNNDREVQLVQHVSQISVLLMKVPRTNLQRERIGFKMQQKQNEENIQK